MEVNRPRFDDSVSQLIRSAERFISQRKFSFAREQLGVAHSLDPRNSYINAIMERLSVLETQGTEAPATPDGQRYLAVSVGPEFAGGVREQEPRISHTELQTRVRQLTSMAERLLERGSPENAFDTLMKAYLLDPVSPYVVSCEKSVLPAWQKAHNQEPVLFSIPSSFQEGEAVNITKTSPPQTTAEQERRLETLKLRKEHERKEHERAVWRQASNPPTVFGIADSAEAPGSPEEDRSLFSRLKQGKFLGR
jgi:hypothetical protein